jgi:hypothetical protein
MAIPAWLSAEINLRAEADRLTRRAAYDAWAKAYSAPTVTIRSLDLTEVCGPAAGPTSSLAGTTAPAPRT